jgi:hypothetical protein
MQADVVAAEGDRPGFNAVDWSIVTRGIFHYTRFGQYSASRNTICRDIAPIGLLLSSGMTGGPKMGCGNFSPHGGLRVFEERRGFE